MPKLSQAKRHLKQLDLTSCVGNFNQQNNPRKVSEEDITTTTFAENEACSDDADFSSVPRLKRRKPSSCLTDLVMSTPTTPSQSRWTIEQQQQQLGGESCMDQAAYCSTPETNPREALTCISPIWGHFVDLIFGDEEKQQQAKEEEPCFSFLNVPVRCPVDLAVGQSARFDPYSYRKNPRQRILSPRRSMAESPQDGNSFSSFSTSSSASFVLQDPTSLPEALSHLRV
eukprot:CAMPEP_0198140852 /NCGR_PEP_ID=MMETSP1443-20131203/3936_1 /TAXON_ID=186043 /ORGANISM="Entomoneis sp., Strain CCMP2396" /LENGTH=227 /DNA_ID=CAMNT_0043803389 /DNA_START=194 /DNA_END=877 /DNA_ORIENTATION=-